MNHIDPDYYREEDQGQCIHICVRLPFFEGLAQEKSILASLIILRKLINLKFKPVSQTCFQTYLLCCLLCIFWHKLNLAPAGRKCPGPRQKLVWKWHRVANEVYHRHNCRTWNENSQVRSTYPYEFMIDATKEVQIVYKPRLANYCKETQSTYLGGKFLVIQGKS